MVPTITVDDRAWRQAARELFQTSSRSLVDFINGQALNVSINAFRETEKANKDAIAHRLGAIGNEVKQVSRGKNKGQFRKGAMIVKEDSFAARILVKRLKDTGKWGIKGTTLAERARNLISAAMRSVNFIRSGWIPCMNTLWNITHDKSRSLQRSSGGIRVYGKPKGKVRPARFKLRSEIICEIENTAGKVNEGRPPAPGGDPMPVAVRGLQKALGMSAANMIEELARRLKRDWAKHGAK